MRDGYANFDRRLEQLEERKAALIDGHRVEVDNTGLMTMRPTGQHVRKVNRLLPLRAFMIMAATLLCFKAFLLYSIGFNTYTSKVVAMRQGDTTDQIGAYLMQIDPVTLWLHSVITFLIS